MPVETAAAFIAPAVVPPVAHEPGSERVVHFRTEFDKRHISAPELAWSVQAQAPPGEQYPATVQRFDKTRNATNRRLVQAPVITFVAAAAATTDSTGGGGFKTKILPARRFLTPSSFVVAGAAPPVTANWPEFKRPEIYRSTFKRKLLEPRAVYTDAGAAVTADWPSFKRAEITQSSFKRTLIEVRAVYTDPAAAAPTTVTPRLEVQRRRKSHHGWFLTSPAVKGVSGANAPPAAHHVPPTYRSSFKRTLQTAPFTYTDPAPAPAVPWPAYQPPTIYRVSFDRRLLEPIRAELAIIQQTAVFPWPSFKRPEIHRSSFERTLIEPILLTDWPAPPAVVADWPSYKRVEIAQSKHDRRFVTVDITATFIAEPVPGPTDFHGFIVNVGRMMR